MSTNPPLSTKPLKQMIRRIVDYVLEDCETIIRVWDEKKEWLDYDVASRRNHCGGGNFLIVQGLMSALNLMSKTYDRLQQGEKNFKKVKMLGAFRVRTEINDEGKAFQRFVEASRLSIDLGFEPVDAVAIWKAFRHPLAHLAAPHYPVRIEGSNSAFDSDPERVWICTARSLHRDVRLSLQWLLKRVDEQSQERINDVQLWLEVENNPKAIVLADLKAPPLQKSELSEGVAEIAFEFTFFRQYRSAYEKYKVGDLSVQRQATTNALLLTTRLVLGFFCDKPKSDDISIQHFLNFLPAFKQKFNRKVIAQLDLTEDIVVHLHKRLAHLTATRWRQKSKSSDAYEKHFDDIEAAISQFEMALPSDLKTVYDAGVRRWLTV